MDFFDKLDSSKGGFIFLSHSHEDIKKVREIRNSLEERGFEPLCFYLKCLDDDSEIEDLIKREIDAREWFVFVNSENSRKSKWVTLEREYITKNNSKKIITVNIDDEKDVLKAVNKLTSNLRVYLAYSHKDIELAKKLRAQLEKKDFIVFDDTDIPQNESYAETVASAIYEAAESGLVIALLTKNASESRMLMSELSLVYESDGNLLIIKTDDAELSPAYYFMTGQFVNFCTSASPDNNEIASIVEKIEDYVIK